MTDDVSIVKEREYKVTKSNIIIQSARSKMTAAEMRIMVYVISKIEMTDKELKPCEISIVDFCRVCDITPDAQYNNLRDITKRLRGRTIEIFEDNGDTIHQVGWLRQVSYYKGKGKVVLQIEDKLAPQLLDLKKNFTSYGLINVLLLKSKYAMQIYELLKSYENIGVWEPSLTELKKLLFADNYKNFNDFKRFVLQSAIEEINEKTDIYTEYELDKEGKKVVGIKFIIKANLRTIMQRQEHRRKELIPKNELTDEENVIARYCPNRQLTAQNKRHLKAWYSAGYDDNMIAIAFERCIDTTGDIHFNYINTIIMNWQAAGVKTPEDAAEEQENFNKLRSSGIYKDYINNMS